MIFRLTGKLAKKLGVKPQADLPAHENPHADWSAHVFLAARTQYILVTNTSALYSVVLHGRDIKKGNAFVQSALRAIREELHGDGLTAVFTAKIEPHVSEVQFGTTLNRSVTGSMNDIIQQIKFYVRERQMLPNEFSSYLNDTPYQYLKYRFPREAIGEVVGG